MRIVVTGALGHIGSRLIREIPIAIPGSTLILIDNLSTQRYSSLFHLPTSATYDFHELNVIDADLSKCIEGADAVVHLAAITNATQSVSMPQEIERHNLSATRNIAETAAAFKVPVVFLSTTSVYGTMKRQVDETAGPEDLIAQTPYAATKLKEEQLLAELGRTRGLQFVIGRFGTIFGASPGMRFHTAVNKFCWQASLGMPVTVWRTAIHQMRPYLDLQDAIRSLLFFLQGRRFDRRVYNVLTFNATVSQIVDAIRAHVPELQVRYVEEKAMNEYSYEVSNARFRGLGFEFHGDLRRSVRETIELLRTAHTAAGTDIKKAG